VSRDPLHALIDRIPEGELPAAQRFLEFLASSLAYRAALCAPVDDEPVTEGDANAILNARAEVRADSIWRCRAGRHQSAERGMAEYSRLRVGDYRFIFAATPGEVTIVRVRQRYDVYR
jgi:hypothetical protein